MRQICFALWYRNRLCLKGIKQPTIMGIGHRTQYGCMMIPIRNRVYLKCKPSQKNYELYVKSCKIY